MPEKGWEVKFETKGVRQTKSGLTRMAKAAERRAETTLSQLAKRAAGIVAKETPVGRTGELGRSTAAQRSGRLKWQIFQTATAPNRMYRYFYGRGVRGGARAPSGGTGLIMPRLKKALYWPGIRGGRPVALVENHPGIRKSSTTPYVKNSLKIINPMVSNAAKEMAASIEKTAFRGFRTGSVK